MNDATWRPLLAELDHWQAEGRTVTLWLRDDDAVAPTAQLDRLAALGERFDVAVLLAVIPFLAEPGLAARLRRAPRLLPCQHGCWHRNHAPPGEKKSELGGHRPREAVLAEIAAARARLAELLEGDVLPVFVPPWNRIDPELAPALPALGLAGLSCFRGFALAGGHGPALANTSIDIMDWRGGRIGRPAPALAGEIAAMLERRRLSGSRDGSLGLLLHHLDHDETAWAFLDGLLALVARHPALAFDDPRRLFAL